MNILEEVEENKITIALIPNYGFLSFDIAEKLSGQNACFIILNKTYGAATEFLKEREVNFKKFRFIDCISTTLRANLKETEQCLYANPRDFSDMEDKIKNVLSKKPGFLIFDSIANLNSYHKEKDTIKFVFLLADLLKDKKVKTILCIPDTIEYNPLVKQISPQAFKIINF
jgi:hypothetical protein